jgi:hypothetical protein
LLDNHVIFSDLSHYAVFFLFPAVFLKDTEVKPITCTYWFSIRFFLANTAVFKPGTALKTGITNFKTASITRAWSSYECSEYPAE